tara:strand:- start:43 stop:1059 length:1017 start_codon:yes stop_codon:yes gene_type:complete
MNRPDLFQIFVAKRDSSGHVSVLYDFIELEKGGEVDVASLEDVIEATGLSREELSRSGRKCDCPEWTLGVHYCHALDRERCNRSNSAASNNDDAKKQEAEQLNYLRDIHDKREQAEAAAAAAAAKEREVGVKKEREKRRDEATEKRVRHYQITFTSNTKTKERHEPSMAERLHKSEFQDGREERSRIWQANREREQEAARRRRADELHKSTLNARLRRELPDLEEQYSFKLVNDTALWCGRAKPLAEVELPEEGSSLRDPDSDDEFDTDSIATSAVTLVTSKHARHRMAKRDIQLREVQSALKHGKRETFLSGTSVTHDKGLCVVHDDKNVITTYREA